MWKMAVKAKMFNKQASDPKSKPDQILQTLALQHGQVVADIGSGGGYFAFRFAQAVGEQGYIYTIDIDQAKLEFIQQSAQEKKVNNLTTVPATENWTLPQKVDLIFMRNVLHHIPNRIQYFAKLQELLKPNGRVAIVEYNGKGSVSFHKLFGHYVKAEVICEEMTQAGYQVAQTADFLAEQSFTVFTANR